jgi:hypothetical protein
MASGHDRHQALRMAASWGVSARWIRALGRRVRCRVATRPVGRPRIPEAERARVRALVSEQLDLQGDASGRTVLAGIRRQGERVSVMLVQQETIAQKRGRRAAKQRGIEEARLGHEVLARDAVWCEDTTHLGRLEGEEEVAGELITDRGSLATVALTAGPPPTAADVMGLRAPSAAAGRWWCSATGPRSTAPPRCSPSSTASTWWTCPRGRARRRTTPWPST